MPVTAPTDLAYLGIAEAGSLFREKQLSPVELTQFHLDRIAALNPTLRAYITVTGDLALEQAKAAELAIQSGDTRPLLGIPMAHKDIYTTAGIRTTGGSAVYEHWVPTKTATTISKLHNEAGAVMMGKLATHEFAFAISNEEHPFPPARNPWNLEHIPGGSSSGSGSAVASGLVMAATGSDTGGSIRHPGMACGIAALKPTYGRCSRYGVLSLSWSLDHTGPMARTTEDVALMLGGMAGYDPMDPASAAVPLGDYLSTLKAGVKGKRMGLLRSWYEKTADPETIAAVEEAVKTLRGLGADVVEIEIPNIDQVSTSIISTAEAYAYHAAHLAATPELYPAPLRNRLLMGGLFSAEEYINTQRARQLLKQATLHALKEVDVLLSPSKGSSALSFAEANIDYYKQPSYLHVGNLTGVPALSIPCGFDSKGLPMGFQIMGRPFEEATVLQIGYAYEQAAGWFKRHPAC